MLNCEDKKELRKVILKQRDEMNSDIKNNKDKILQDKFFNSEYYKNAHKIFIYISYGSEINTKDIIEKAIEDKKEIYVPRTIFKDKHMDAVRINSLDNLNESRYGTLEPGEEEKAEDPNLIDLIVVPGSAFDAAGGRMGYGAGYYDRYFKRIDSKNIAGITKLALAYDFQIVDHIPMEEHDERVDIIYTESREIILNDNRK